MATAQIRKPHSWRSFSLSQPPTKPVATVAEYMAAHCTDCKRPVRPNGWPRSTIKASTTTSENATPTVGITNSQSSRRIAPGSGGTKYR